MSGLKWCSTPVAAITKSASSSADVAVVICQADPMNTAEEDLGSSEGIVESELLDASRR